MNKIYSKIGLYMPTICLLIVIERQDLWIHIRIKKPLYMNNLFYELADLFLDFGVAVIVAIGMDSNPTLSSG